MYQGPNRDLNVFLLVKNRVSTEVKGQLRPPGFKTQFTHQK